jgi:hypothetical protein
LFSIFARQDTFSAVSRALNPVFMFYAPRLIFDGTKGIGSRFHVLRVRTRFRRYRGRRIPISYFALPDSFLAVPRASGPFSMFFAPGHIFGGTDFVGSNFHVLHSRTRSRWYRGRLVSFSCFVCPDSFSDVRTMSRSVFLFCVLRLVFGSSEGFGSRFNLLYRRTRFRRYRGRRVPFSCFMRPDAFSAVPSASGPVFMFCAPILVFDGTEGIGSRLHVLRSGTRFGRYRGRRVPFSCFALPDSFSTVPRAPGPVFMFSASVQFSAVPRASDPVVMFCAPGIIFGGIGGVRSRFLILRARNHFWRYRGCRVPFSCLTCPDPFSVVTRVFGPVFVF